MKAQLRPALGEAVAALALHPLRSFLTALTVTFGTAVLLVLMSYGTGAPQATAEVLKQMGSTQIKIQARMGGMMGSKRGKPIDIRYDDLDMIRAAAPSVGQMAAGIQPGMGSPVFGPRRSWPWAGMRGVGSEYLDVCDLQILEGRWFTPEEEQNRARVAVMNLPLAKGMFEDESPLGEWIDSRGRRFEIIGVLYDAEAFAYSFYVPYTACYGLGGKAGGKAVDWLSIKPASPAVRADAIAEMRTALGRLYNFDASNEKALAIEEQTAFIAQVEAVSTGLRWLVLTISLVALVLGCLGAANVVGITVAERTGELGLRKALGATPDAIRLQILAESLLLCVAGGLAGIALGSIAVRGLGPLALSQTVLIAPRADVAQLVVGMGILVLVGACAGWPAANRAARLDPAVTLREA